MNTFTRILLFSLCFTMGGMLMAQTQPTSAQESMARKEIEKRGLNETEVRTRLAQEGIIIEQIPPSDLPKYQGQIIAILNEMEKEKNEEGSSYGPRGSSRSATPASAADIIKMERAEAEDRVTEEEAEAIQKKMADSASAEGIYGHGIFTTQALEVFRTTDGSRAPDNYVLGAGDAVRVTIFGSSQADLLLEINSQGFVQPQGLPKIFLQGMELSRARKVLEQRLSGYYTFRSDQISVTVQTARTINVNIFGEVALKGGFNISALNTALNAISAAGGPTEIGSVRNIELVSGGKRRIIDVYSVMNNPGDIFQYDLQHNDIIFVPVAQKIVKLKGAVRRPMHYELKDKETLQDLIRFAGGLKANAFPDVVRIRRIENGEEVILEYSLVEAMAGKTRVDLYDGDIIDVKSITRSLEKFVEITGENSLFYPGQYSLQQTATLTALIEKAQLREQAKTDLIFVERMFDDETHKVISVNYDSLVEVGGDLELQRRDKVIVFTKRRYLELESITVEGDVREPFSRAFRFDNRLTLANALALAGGMKPTASTKAYIFRRDLTDPKRIRHISVDLVQDWDFKLQPGDRLLVYDQSMSTRIPLLSVQGEVISPFTTAFESGLTINQLLKMAGGLTEKAAMNRVEVFRLNMSTKHGTSFNRMIMQVDSNMELLPQFKDFVLQPFDQLLVRKIPMYEVDRTIQVSGHVYYPGVYPLESGRYRLSDLITRAGGLTPEADDRHAFLMRSFEEKGYIGIDLRKAMNNKGDDDFDPILFENDVVTIAKFDNTIGIFLLATRMGFAKRLSQTARMSRVDSGYHESRNRSYTAEEMLIVEKLQDPKASADSTAFYLDKLNASLLEDIDKDVQRKLMEAEMESMNFVYRGRRSARWYVRNYAGGFAKKADRSSVTVTLPNGQVRGTRTYVWGLFKKYPKVIPGSEIALNYKEEKVKTDRQRIDWSAAVSNTSQAIVSAVTLFLLIDRVAN